MQINIPDDAGALARQQAEAAGFPSVNDYVANLIRHQPRGGASGLTRAEALEDLRQLRKEIPKLSTQEIVELVHEARADLL